MELQTWNAQMPDRSNEVFDMEAFLSMLVELLTLNGNAREVALLATGEISLQKVDDDHYSYNAYYLQIKVPSAVYVDMSEVQKTQISNIICAYTSEALTVEECWIRGVTIRPDLKPRTDWRAEAIRWLRGEGINNQGKVRSDNIASRQYDGLLFRSFAEINLYRALKDLGIMFAPLPVYLRGGKSYQRIEPDFVILWNGIVMVVEVDGDSVHRETPAEADKRTRAFKYEGAIIEHVAASECETYEKAKHCAGMLLTALEKAKDNR